MYCPQCGNLQGLNQIRFCTKCGMDLSEVRKLLSSQINNKKRRKRNNAARQGLAMIISGFFLMLMLIILGDFFTLPKFLMPSVVIIFIIGGAIRIISPKFFGTNDNFDKADTSNQLNLETQKLSSEQILVNSLPPAEYNPSVNFDVKKYNTNELNLPVSVVEETTKQLEKDSFNFIRQTE